MFYGKIITRESQTNTAKVVWLAFYLLVTKIPTAQQESMSGSILLPELGRVLLMLFMQCAFGQACLSLNNGMMRLCRTFVRVSFFFPKKHQSSSFESPD